MAKIIKLTERDLRSIINKVKIISEQGLPTYEKTDKGVPPYPKPEETDVRELGPVHHDDEGNLKIGPPPPVVEAKRSVLMNLNQALSSMKMLVNLSGVNTEIPDDIEKVIEKFNTLYGHRQEKLSEKK